MDNIYVRTIVLASIALLGAFLLNLVLNYTDNTVSTWALTFVAFVVGTFISLRLQARRSGPGTG